MAIAALLGLVIVNAVPDWEQQTNLRNDSATGRLGGEASLPLFTGAQKERKLTAAYLARPTAKAKAALEKQRVATDAGLKSFRRLSGTELHSDQRHRWEYVEAIYSHLHTLPAVRKKVNARTSSADAATDYYTKLIIKMIRFYQALSAMDDPDLTLETRPLVGLFYASDALSQQDMLITQARAAGHMTPAHRADFAEAYGTGKVMYERWIAPYLPRKERALYDQITTSREWKALQAAQRSVITPPTDEAGNPQIGDGSALARWDSSHGQVSGQIAKLNLARTQGLLAHGFQRADEVRNRALLQVFASIAAIIAIAGLIIWLTRSISARLRQLRTQTEDGAQRLPTVVARLRRGEKVNPEAEFPSPDEADEFGHVRKALVDAQRRTVGLAAEQAADRRGLDGFVAATTDRTLGQIGRSLDLMQKVMNRPDADPLLDDLITTDGAIAASRRHQENLSALTSSTQQFLYNQPKALLDLVNDAAVETGEPKRVRNEVDLHFHVAPQHVGGVLQVVAALLDNGLRFSNDHVTVRSRTVVNGAALDIEDAGGGMSQPDLDAANKALSQPEHATFEAMAAGRGRLGHFVVARLAMRHHLSVELRRSAYGGVTAAVMIDNKASAPAPAAQPLPAEAPPTSLPGPVVGQQVPLPRRAASVPQAAAAGQGVSPRRASTETPRPTPVQPAAGLPEHTDTDAPALPRRAAGEHVHPALRDSAPAPAAPPPSAADASDVAEAWSGYQAATHQAAQYLTQQSTDLKDGTP
ncbi:MULTISPECIES: nitrate- and nitrite sensing domain-containing protein [Streptomyces]|uniref:nitrate- and nitrite sensing domain-containing protein n=1 Tax=Streptomyces TaxID=1883 RepID=UPI0023EB2505|nr:nitrate- and nitrite sensing domain-containing protein [Streptomyces sp. WMMB303]MDF4249564.1 nitrate- and nitrite sensing domain-containing protein [Streptomyces sp. WMMB303]